MLDQVVDLEEAVGSYLNCLSTSCAAGSKLYTSVGKLVDEKFQELFPAQESKLFFQALQTQNAFEGYQKALLECKEKLLEILIDNHTKRQPTKEKTKQGKTKSSTEEQYAGVALRVAKELYCYHQTVADVLKPLHFSDCQEDIENATLTNIEGKTDVVAAWMTIIEGNKLLRSGYGLTNSEVSQILSWQHGEDITESSRKRLNQQVNTLIQQYVDRMFNHAVCEQDIPVAFNAYPDEIQKILQACCNPTESLAASAQGFLSQKEEITTMLHRELPRVFLCLNGKKFDKAHPGKAYENATLKMRAVRESVSNAIEAKKIVNSKEQLDLFCLRVLAISSISAASAACRTAVVMALGKVNLVQVQPVVENDKHIILDVHKETIEIHIHSKWVILEDTALFTSLCRGNPNQIATIHVTYHAEINIEQFFVNRVNPVPVAHITQCILQQAPSNQSKKEQGRERSKSIKIKLTKATNKLFQRKSMMIKSEVEAIDTLITNEFASHGSMSDDLDLSSKTTSENGYNTSSDSQDESQPVPPPRHKRKARKTKKSRAAATDLANGGGKEKKSIEGKKEDLAWFSASNKFGIPLVPTLSGSKTQSPSLASFEELQGVIDFLSGSSTSSLAINEKGEKIRQQNLKTHKRNNSTTSLPQADSKAKANSEGKLKLCHKKSASFSGKATDLVTAEPSASATLPLSTPVVPLSQEMLKKKDDPKDGKASDGSGGDTSKSPNELVVVAGVERTPGDGMDNRINKDLFQSTANIDAKTVVQGDTTATVSSTKQQEKGKEDSVNGEQSVKEPAVTGAVVENQEQLPDTTQPYFDPSDLFSESKHVTLSKEYDASDVVKSLPSNLNAGAFHILPSSQFQKSSTVAQLETVNYVGDKAESSGSKWDKPTVAKPPLPPSSSSASPLDLTKMDPSAFELEQVPQKPANGTLYEPFNSRTAWPVGLGGTGGGSGNGPLGGSRFSSLWSEATLETEKSVVNEERGQLSPAISTASSSAASKTSEIEFTLDKQQDFHKLLEGSKFLSGYHQQSFHDNWKDRHYAYPGPNPTKDYNVPPPQQNIMPNSNAFDAQSDPWPVHSSNFGSRDNFPSSSYNPHNNANNYQQQQKQQQQQQQPPHMPRNNIEALQLPPNPVGPYMRQNREQLLAKQQILEQYARQQKQMQKQQGHHQPPHKNIAFPPSHPKGNGGSLMTSSRSGMVDRVGSTSSIPPPGLNNSKFDMLSGHERPFFQRSTSQQSRSPRPMSTQGYPSFGAGGMGGLHHHQQSQQSRSASEVRLENTGGFFPPEQLMNDRMPPYRDHFNQQLQQDVFSSRY